MTSIAQNLPQAASIEITPIEELSLPKDALADLKAELEGIDSTLLDKTLETMRKIVERKAGIDAPREYIEQEVLRLVDEFGEMTTTRLQPLLNDHQMDELTYLMHEGPDGMKLIEFMSGCIPDYLEKCKMWLMDFVADYMQRPLDKPDHDVGAQLDSPVDQGTFTPLASNTTQPDTML